MRRFLPFLLVLACACADRCSGGKVQGTTARVRVPAGVAFAKTYVGEAGRVPVLVEAIGSGPVQLAGVSVAEPGITLENGDPRVIPGGTSTTVTLVWRPTAAGALETTLHVSTDVEDARELDVAVSGASAVMPDCDDHNPCTDDTFDRASETCRHANRDGACDDGNACTTDDRCLDGACRGRALSCDDDDVCTLNLCDPVKGCVFPPDGRQCDDHDPCTKDVCDRDSGCSHPDADTGTACGTFSCKVAHLCVLGKCRELDIAGRSDGFPCFDGDLCTEDDACEAGECVGGPRIQAEPTVLKSFETFGAQGDFLASDGFRYLFASPTSLRIAERDSSGGLEIKGGTLLPSTVQPAPAEAAGHFLLAAQTMIMQIDATDPTHVALDWSAQLPNAPTGPAREVRRLWKVDAGLLVLAKRAGADDELLYVPRVVGSQIFGTPRVLYSAPQIDDADTDGARVVVSSPTSMRWFQLAPGGAPTDVVLLQAQRNARVAVQGNRVGVAIGGSIGLYAVAPVAHEPWTCAPGAANCRELGPGCDGTFAGPVGHYQTCAVAADCPDQTCRLVGVDDCPTCDRSEECSLSCCESRLGVCFHAAPSEQQYQGGYQATEPVRDLAFVDGTLFGALPSGIFAFDPNAPEAGPALAGRRVDPVSAVLLDHAPGRLLAMGDVALPFDVTTGTDGLATLSRITGTGHGNVVTVADDGASAVVAGPVAVGRIDLLSQEISAWKLLDTASSPNAPRILDGTNLAGLVDLHASFREDRLDPACFGVETEVVQASTFAPANLALCSLQNASLEAAGHFLLADGDLEPDIRDALPRRGLQLWDLAHPSQPPVVLGPDDDMYVRDIRATLDGTLLKIGATGPDLLKVQQLSAAHPADVREYTFPFVGATAATRTNVGADGRAWIVAKGQEIALFSADPTGVTPLTRLSEAQPVNQTIEAMGRGRAWAVASPPGGGFSWMLQLAYDAAQPASLTSLGKIDLDEPVSRVVDTGPAAIVLSPHSIKVVRPACR